MPWVDVKEEFHFFPRGADRSVQIVYQPGRANVVRVCADQMAAAGAIDTPAPEAASEKSADDAAGG